MNNLIGISGKIGSGKDTLAKMIQCIESEYSKEDTLIAVTENDIIKESSYEVKRFADKLKDITCMLIGCTREELEDREFKEAPLGEEWDRCRIFDNDDNLIDIFRTKKAAEIIYAKQEGFYHIEKEQMTPRKIMQLLGTEGGRKILHPNIWVNSLFADYKPTGMNTKPLRSKSGFSKIESFDFPNWIIPDTRFPNEAQAIKDRGGILIRVNRPLRGYYIASRSGRETENFPTEQAAIDAFGGKDALFDDYQVHWETLKRKNEHPSETALDNYEDWDYVIENDGTMEDLLDKVKTLYNES